MAALPALRVLVCAGISLRQSISDRQLVYASCHWVVDGRGLVLVPLSFLVFGGVACLRLAQMLWS